MRPVTTVEVNPSTHSGLDFLPAGGGLQVDKLVFERLPQAFDEDIVQETALTIHGEAYAGLF